MAVYVPPTHLLAKIRQHKPDYIVVHTDDDDEEPVRVNCPNHRNRAHKALRTISEVPGWVRVELFDKKNGLLARHERSADDESPAGELEQLMPTREHSNVSGLVTIMLKAQDMVLSRHMATMQPVLDTLFKLVDVSMKRLDLVEKQYEHALKVNASMADDVLRREIAIARAAAGHVDDDDDEGRAGPMLDKLLPAIIQAGLSGPPKKKGAPDEERPKKSDAKPNGVKPNGARKAA